MTTDMLDFPTVEAVPMPAQQEPALPATTTDLKKVDLQAVALAQFGDWRTDVAAARKNLGTLALDLTIPARIAEAKSLRQRLINAPIADARAVSKALKSKLAQVSKAVGAEEEAAVAAYTDAGELITPKIEAAEKRIEDERLKRLKEEADRLAGLREKVDTIMAAWIARSQAEGMTSDRLAVGIEAFKALKVPADLTDVDVHWCTAHASTLSALDHAYLALRRAELEAAQAKARAEQQRVAGIQARIAEIQAAATGHERASAADLMEARTVVAALQVSEALYQEFTLIAQAAQAGTLAVLDKLHAEAVEREAEQQRADDALLAALQAPPEPFETTTAQPGAQTPVAQEGVAENPVQSQPAVSCVDVGDVAADGAGDGSQPAATPPTPAAASVIGNPPFSADDGPLETSEADAQPYVAPPATPAPAMTHAAFLALVMTAFDCKFPSHPKPSQAWWAEVRAAGFELQGL